MSERSERNGAGGGPPDIVRSAYAELIVTDLARAREFWVDLLGFVVSAEEPDALYLRGYEEFVHHSLILRTGSDDRLRAHRLPGADARGPRPGRAVVRRPRLPDQAHPRRHDPRARRGRACPRSARLHHRARARDGQGGAAGPALRPPPGRQHLADRPRQHRRARRPRRLRVLHGSRLRSVGDHRGRRRHALRGVDVPQANSPRRRLHARRRADAPPPRVRRAGVAPHPRAVRHHRRPRPGPPHRAGPRPSRRVQRVLRLPP